LFHEYFHAETAGPGGQPQTGWTALVIRFLEAAARRSAAHARAARPRPRPPGGTRSERQLAS
jgi:hypothetical protein